MCMALCSSLILLMFEKEIRLCFVASWLVVSGTVFSLRRFGKHPTPCRFCGAPDGDGHLFWECTFPPLVEIREIPEFHDLMRMDEAHWPRFLLWHGWLPMPSGVNGALPWAADASESAGYLVEAVLGRYSSDLLAGWGPSDGYDEVEAVSLMPDHPNVWSDGSLFLDQVTGVSSSDAGFFAHQSENCWSGMSMVFVQVEKFRLVEVSVLFLGLCSQFRELKCGVPSQLCSPLVRFTLVLTIWVWFVVLGDFLMVVLVPLLLSLSRMVICSCLFGGCFALGFGHSSNYQGYGSC